MHVIFLAKTANMHMLEGFKENIYIWHGRLQGDTA